MLANTCIYSIICVSYFLLLMMPCLCDFISFLWLFQFNNIFNTIFSSPPTVVIIVGTLLDNTLDAKRTFNDRGFPWWAPFQNRHGDPRNDEFYRLPLRLNEFMPTRFFWITLPRLLYISNILWSKHWFCNM